MNRVAFIIGLSAGVILVVTGTVQITFKTPWDAPACTLDGAPCEAFNGGIACSFSPSGEADCWTLRKDFTSVGATHWFTVDSMRDRLKREVEWTLIPSEQ